MSLKADPELDNAMVNTLVQSKQAKELEDYCKGLLEPPSVDQPDMNADNGYPSRQEE